METTLIIILIILSIIGLIVLFIIFTSIICVKMSKLVIKNLTNILYSQMKIDKNEYNYYNDNKTRARLLSADFDPNKDGIHYKKDN